MTLIWQWLICVMKVRCSGIWFYITLFFHVEQKNIKYALSPLNTSQKIPDIFLALLKIHQFSRHVFSKISQIPDNNWYSCHSWKNINPALAFSKLVLDVLKVETMAFSCGYIPVCFLVFMEVHNCGKFH